MTWAKDNDTYLVEHLYLRFQRNPAEGLEAWLREFNEAVTSWQFARCQRLLREAPRFGVSREEHIKQIRECTGELATEVWQWERAGDVFTQLAEQATKRWTRGEYLLRVADTQRLRGKFTEALDYYRESFDLLRQGAPAAKLLYNLHMTGVTYWSLERFDDALSCYHRSLSGYEQLDQARGGDPELKRHMANIKRDMAQVFRKKGKVDRTIELLGESLSLLKATGDLYEQGLTLLGLGRAYHVRDQYGEANDYYEQASQIFESVGTRLFQSEALFRLCQLSFDRGEFERALLFASQVQEIALHYGFHDWAARSLRIVGDVVLIRGDVSEASAAYAQACAYALEYSSVLFERTCQHVKARIAELQARNHTREAQALYEDTVTAGQKSGIDHEMLEETLGVLESQPL